MAEQSPATQCIDAFMRRDYERCADRSVAYLKAALDANTRPEFEAALVFVISLERMGRNELAFNNAAGLYKQFAPWERDLMMLAIGRGRPDEMLNSIGSSRDDAAAKKMWQLNYCFGAQSVSRHKWDDARKAFQVMLEGRVQPVSCMETVLTVVEYNYLVHGSALSEFDKPIVDLNLEAAKTADPAQALIIARRAHAEAQKALGKQHPAYITTVNNLAALHMKLGRFAEAEPYLKDTIALRRAARGDDDDEVVNDLNMLGALYTKLGKREQAGACYAEALKIVENRAAG